MALSAKRRVFIEEYLRCWNASEAARRAEYAYPGREGYRLLKNAEIQQAIQDRLDELKMEADEVLVRLAEQARADIGPYLQQAGDGYEVDLEALKKAGLTHLIKKLSYDKDGNQRLELYDAQAALVQLGRAHGLFTDRVDVTSQGEKLKTYVGVSPDDWDDDDGSGAD